MARASKRVVADRVDRDAAPLDVARLDAEGWVAVPGVLEPAGATALARRCAEVLASLDGDVRVGDKRAAGTRRLVDLAERVPEALVPFDDDRVRRAVRVFLPNASTPRELTYRCPQPGFGEQRFHADDIPLTEPGAWRVVTAIAALCDFTEVNGATAVIPGSHRRPDLQRRSGDLVDHPDAVTLTGRAGTVFVFCGHLLHRGTRNASDAARPALQVSWRSDGP